MVAGQPSCDLIVRELGWLWAPQQAQGRLLQALEPELELELEPPPVTAVP